MFTGQFKYSVDVKGRISIPAKLRKQFSPEAGNRVVMNIGSLNYIELYPQDEWKHTADELKALNKHDPKNALFLRKKLQHVTEDEMDAQSRILLPQELMKIAKIDKEVLILGQIDKIEIWNPEEFAKYIESSNDNLEQLEAEVMAP